MSLDNAAGINLSQNAFFSSHALKETFSLMLILWYKTNQMCFSIVCTLIDNDICCGPTQRNMLTTVMMNISVNKSTDNT